jgi:CO dehydrogenase/acetyl-CoA synthase gamma subunit (corrinoid Fe-S protein)
LVRKDNTFFNQLFTDIFIVHSFQEFTILNFNDLLTAIPVDPRSAIDFKGGESVAIDRLNHYLWPVFRRQ